ncbi:MAG: PEP/pyruvate-binding domain-containing protein, partial [Planctomycetales bacterium]
FGGKGHNLARLKRLGFQVPAGGILIADVYRRFMQRPELAVRVEALREAAAEDVLQEDVADRLSQLRDEIKNAPLESAVEDALRRLLEQPDLAGQAVAVRSSAVSEDGPTTSFAGIHQSFLNVCGLDDVVQSVKRCFASLWTTQAVAYRRKFKITDDDASCAVVICAMVVPAAEDLPVASGVSFSCDPRTGRRDLSVVNAAAEIGEAVVSGDVNPDEFHFLANHGLWSIAKRPSSPTVELSDQQLLELARLVDRIQGALGDSQDPQDVEWVFDGQRFWILQARPVTHLPHNTWPEAVGLPVHWSNANVKDAVPGVLTPLTWSASLVVIRQVAFAPLALAGVPVPPGMEVIRRHSGRAY